ncbi:MAG: hypothetical protein JXR96_26305 [Deltaproteobacteria bacterium]|nr:hypothetical protein [Deltaproteobacteria bacterium]
MRGRLGLCIPIALLVAAGCGEVERVTGSVSGSVPWGGTWPAEGSMLVALFRVAPWDPDFVPGPPAAYCVLQRPTGSQADFALTDLAFDVYDSLVVAWSDPDPVEQSKHMLPVSVHGTELDRLEEASAIDLDAAQPDREGLVLPEMILYEHAEDMRSHYTPDY